MPEVGRISILRCLKVRKQRNVCVCMCSESKASLTWPSLGTLMLPKIEMGHKRTEHDQRPEGKGVLLTNGRNLKGGVRALLGSLAWGTWEKANSTTGLHISGYRHSPAVSKRYNTFS